MHHHFQCTLCGAEYDPLQVPYVCPSHGDRGILDTVYDYRQVGAETSPQAISASRDFSIWRYLPLLPLDPSVQSLFPLQVGWTPLYPAKRSGVLLGLSALFLKDEGRNPTASLKDRASAVVVGKARKSDGRGNPPGCPISGGSPSRPYLLQRFTPLDTFQKRFPLP